MVWMIRCLSLLVTGAVFFLPPLTYAMGSPPVESPSQVSEQPHIAFPFSLTEQGVSVVVSPVVPDAFSHAVTLYSPEKDHVVFADKVLVKGVNRYLTDVFVNNTRVSVRKDGRFFYNVSLPKFGQNLVWIQVLTPDFRILSLPIYVTRLQALGEDRTTSDAVLLSNSRYAVTSNVLALKMPLRRDTLAEAIFTYKNAVPDSSSLPKDTPNPKVAKVVASKWMTGFPDGSFKPDQPVKLIDYIVTLVHTLNLDPKKYETVVLPYQDVPLDHWTTPYIRAAYAEQLIPSSSQLHVSQVLTYQHFVSLWPRVPGVRAELDALVQGRPQTLSQVAIRQSLSAAVVQVNTLRGEVAKAARFELITPEDNTTVYQSTVSLRGRVYPLSKVQVNSQQVVPSMDGTFSAVVTLDKPGTHVIRLSTSFADIVRKVVYVPGYQDMTGHWAGKTSAAFAQLGWRFDDAPAFEPRKPVTRLEMAVMMDKLFFAPATTLNVTMKDVPESYRDVVRRVVAAGWLSTYQDRFYGQQNASKAEMAVVLRRALKIDRPETVTAVVFLDVPTQHWSAPDVAALVSANVLTPGGRFDPSRSITRAEFIAILAKVPVIQSRIKVLEQ